MFIARLLAAAWLCAAAALSSAPARAGMMERGDGVHTESWFINQSFGDLREELAAARGKGKGFVVIWEQPGCVTCQRLHEVNFRDQALVDWIKPRYDVMVLNMFGETEVTDFDGQAMPEKDLAFKHKVNFTPTTIFFDGEGREVFRLPGYFKPYFYLAGYVFVHEKGYADEASRGMLPRWMQTRGELVTKAYGKPADG